MLNQLLEQATGERHPADALHKFANTVSSVEQKKAAWRLRWSRQHSRQRSPAHRQEETSLSSFCSSTRSLGLRANQRSGAQTLETRANVANFNTDAAQDEVMLNAVPSSSSIAVPAQAGAVSARSSMDSGLSTTSLRRFHREARRQEPLLQELKSLQDQVKKQMPICQSKKQVLSYLGDRFRRSMSVKNKESLSIKRLQTNESPLGSPHGSGVLSPTTCLGLSEFTRNQQASPQGSSAQEAWDPDKYLRELEELELLEEQDEALDQARSARARAQGPVAAFLAAVEAEDCDADRLFHLPKRGPKGKMSLHVQSTVGTRPVPSSSCSSMHKIVTPPPVPPPPRPSQGGGRRGMARGPGPLVPRDAPPKIASHPEKGVCSSSQRRACGEVRRVVYRRALQQKASTSEPVRSPGEGGAEPAEDASSLAASCLRSRARDSFDVSLAELSILPMKVGSSSASSPSPRPRQSRRASRRSGASNADTDVDQNFADQMRRRFSISAMENKLMVQQQGELFRPSSKHR